MIRVGLISDTHGLLRPEALAFLAGASRIIHAGDIGNPGILEALGAVAPVTVVRGNTDREPWAAAIPATETLRIGAVEICVVHDRADVVEPVTAQAVVCGHSHQPLVERRGGVLWVNPGSAGRRRFKLPISVGELLIDGPEISARVVELGQSSPSGPSRKKSV